MIEDSANSVSPRAIAPRAIDVWRIGALLLFALIIVTRLINISADPPMHFTRGQGIYTDPAAYTNYARHAQIFDDSNPLEDDRFPLFEHSAISYLSRPVFELFGYGMVQGSLVALMFSLSTILLIFLIVRRSAGIESAVFALFFLLLNENQYHYGRLPFLENAMIFFGAFSFWLIHNLPRTKLYSALAGAALPCAFLFGKAHGLVFMPIFAVYSFWRFRFWRFRRQPEDFAGVRDELKTRVVPFALGALALCVLWYALIGHQALATIARYVGEQSTGIYGAPDAFESLNTFYWRLVGLGTATNLWTRMPEAALISFVVLTSFLYAWAGSRGKLPREAIFSGATIFFLVWVVGAYFSLFFWNYKPLRYQLTMIYPVVALGGIGLGYLWRRLAHIAQDDKKSMAKPSQSGWSLSIFYLALFAIINVVVHEVYVQRLISENKFSVSDENAYVIIGLSLGVTLVTFLLDLLRRRRPNYRPDRHLLITLVWALPLLSMTVGGWWFTSWLSRPTYTMEAASVDLEKVLGPEAVISGSYGVGLSQDNRLPAIIHMFGVADPDTSFFERFPVTHLLLDKPGKEMFEKYHPALASRTEHLHTYHVTNVSISLLRVAGATGNKQADKYHLSAFERSQLVLAGQLQDPDQSSIAELMNMDSANLAVNLYMSTRSEGMGELPDALFFMKCAVSVSPTDFNLQAELGRLNAVIYKKTGRQKYLQDARKAFAEAHRINPVSTRIKHAMEELELSVKRLK